MSRPAAPTPVGESLAGSPPAPGDAPTPAALARTLRGQMPGLDALRGLAIVVVIAHRANVTTSPESLPARAACALMDGGWVGVQLFFVLSGFLITGILLDSRDGDGYYRSFFARRVLRIFPLYYLVLVTALLVVPLATGRQPAGHEHQAWLWVYLSNWMEPFGRSVAAFPHFWSLGVEEQFYFVWPFVVRLCSRRGLGAVCLALVGVAIASRLAVIRAGLPREAAYMFTTCRIDALALGAGAALALRIPERANWLAARERLFVWMSVAMFVVGAAMTGAYQRLGTMNQAFGYTILAWCSAMVVVMAVLAQARGTLLAPAPLRSIGKYSYAMYILHVPIHHELGVPLLARFAGPNLPTWVSVGYFVALAVASYVAALASYHLVEKWFLRLKRRFPVARPAAV
jgi:peptidoglycan/LPS O-acetylase OafA/YrhL